MKQFSDLINSEKPVLVGFLSGNCVPSLMLEPVLKEVASLTAEMAKTVKVNIDSNKEAAEQYEVFSVPALLVFKRGEVQWRSSGRVSADRIREILYLFS